MIQCTDIMGTVYTFAAYVFATHTELRVMLCAVDRKVWKIVCFSSFCVLLLNLIALERILLLFRKECANLCAPTSSSSHTVANRLWKSNQYWSIFCNAMPGDNRNFWLKKTFLDQCFHFQYVHIQKMRNEIEWVWKLKCTHIFFKLFTAAFFFRFLYILKSFSTFFLAQF